LEKDKNNEIKQLKLLL